MASLKGVWQFNEALTQPENNVTWNVRFACGGVTYTNFQKTGTVSMSFLAYLYSDDNTSYSERIYCFNNTAAGWLNLNCRFIDFGEAEQEVEDAFYTWLVSNATVYTGSIPVVTAITWDGDTTGLEVTLQEDKKACYKVSDLVLTEDDFIGAVLRCVFTKGGASQEPRSEYSYTDLQNYSNNGVQIFAGGNYKVVSGTAGTTYTYDGVQYTIPEDGTYFYYYHFYYAIGVTVFNNDYYFVKTLYLPSVTAQTTDTKPIYKRVNDSWVKRTAYERQSGEWVQISTGE